MQTIHVTNVNEALPTALMLLGQQGVPHNSRYGKAIRLSEPVATVYQFPTERVLFDPMRNANPFFHFFEALWILGGQKDVAFLAQFNERIVEFSDDGIEFHAPYGFRLRKHFGFDQIERVIAMLRENSNTRQAVLQIWDPVADLDVKSKDIPCNDIIMLSVREDGCLHIIVSCRSNDMIWGAYGANVVQFSMLQEYIAARIFCGVGTYTQMSWDFHVYEDNPYWQWWQSYTGGMLPSCNAYDAPLYGSSERVKPYPLFEEPEFDLDLSRFFDLQITKDHKTSAFGDVVVPMLAAWRAHKARDYVSAQEYIAACAASDWRLACGMWLHRVEQKHQAKGG